MKEGFRQIKKADWRGWAAEPNHAAIIDALLDGQDATPVSGGRGTTAIFPIPNGTAYLRRYARGGAARFLLRNSYFLDNRPRREFELLHTLHQEGLPVPQVLGACWRNRFGFYQGAIATRALDGENLYDYLRNTGESPETVLRLAGATIRKLHDAHVWHADLQLRNILITPGGVYLIDFDNARRIPQWRPIHGQRNLLRLKRSFEKLDIPDTFFAVVCEGYGGSVPPAWLGKMYRIKGQISDGIRGRHSEHE